MSAGMTFLSFMFQTVIISLSGVMAPGPITAATIGKGSDSPHAGAFIALGHGIIEIPLMILIFFGFGYFLNIPDVKLTVSICGGLFLLYMGYGMFSAARGSGNVSDKSSRSPFLSGIVLSAGNPYFLVWWATIGASLIISSSAFGMAGFIIFTIVHWLCDLIWYYFLSAVSFKGGKVFGAHFQSGVFLICSALLVFFGIKYLIGSLNMIL